MEPTTTHVTDLAYAADLIKCAQVTTDYQDIACKLAGPLVDTVRRIFPGHLLAVYLLTDVNRRQVWNAYLSSPRVGSYLASCTEGDFAELRVKLLICRSHTLIVDGYGSSEKGLLGLYGKLGPEALTPDFYVLFHATLTANEHLRRSLAHAPAIDPQALSLLFTFPLELQSYNLARELIKGDDHLQFMELYDHIVGREFPNKEAHMDRLHQLCQAGRGWRHALKVIRNALPFPPQIVPDDRRLRFIRNGTELIKLADRYRNCLRDYLPNAFGGERQYYEWQCATPAIIELQRHRGPIWYVSTISLKNNADPSEALEGDIRAHLARHGIGHRTCIADLFDRFLSQPVDIGGELEVIEAMNVR